MAANEIKEIGSFPSPLLPKSVKDDPVYGLKVGKAIETSWLSNKNNNFDQRQSLIQQWRSYATGTQNIDKYKKWFNPTGENNYLNLDWSVVPIIPKFVNSVLFSVLSNDFEVNVKAIDALALSTREQKKNELVGRIIAKDKAEELKKFGIELFPEDPSLPQTLEEVDVYMDTTFRQAVEIAADIVINFVFESSDFPQEIRKEIIYDAIVCGFGIAKDETDLQDGVVVRHVDSEYFVHSYTRKKDLSDCFYMGEVRFMTISELKRQAGKSFTEYKYQKIAEQYAGKFGNPSNFATNERYLDGYLYYDYDDYQIQVLDFEYKTPNSLKFEKKDNKYGSYTFTRKDDKYTPPKQSKYNREQVSYNYIDIYKGCYVLGTEYIYNWGQKENIPRSKDNPRNADFSYKVYVPELYKGNFNSLVAKMIPYADQIQLAYLKIQQAVANAAPDGYAINLTSLDAVNIGDGELTPIVINDIYQSTGRMYYRQETDDFQRVGPPITPMPNPLQNIVNYANQIDFYIRMLREVTGIVPEREGITQRDQLVGVTQMAIEASNNATGYINHAIRSITRRLAESVLLRVQDIPVSNILYKQYVEAVGRANMAVIDAMDSFEAHKFGVDITIGSKDPERLALERDISAAVQAGELRIEDRIELINIKNPKQAIQLLKIRRKKYQQEKQQEQMMLSQANAQFSAQASQVSEQSKQQTLALENQLKMQYKEFETQQDIIKLQAEYGFKAQLETGKGTIELQKKGLEVQSQDMRDKMKEDRKDDRTKIQAEQQSELIEQRQNNKPPKKFMEDDFDFLNDMAGEE